jgi:positive regulator of sigma E activity
MRKSADVLEILDRDTAKVMLYKHKKCHGCGFCNKHMHPGSVFTAANPVRANAGEMVDVNVHKRFSYTEFFIAYVLPTVAFFGGLFLGSLIFPGKSGAGAAVAAAFILLAAAIAVNVVFRKKYRPIYTVSIVKRILPAEPRI